MEIGSLSDIFNGDGRCCMRTLMEQPSPNTTGDINLPQSDLFKVKIEQCDVPMETETCADQWSLAEPSNEQPNILNPVSWVVFPAEEPVPIKSEPVGEDESFTNAELMGDQEGLSSVTRDDKAIASNVVEIPAINERCYSSLIGECVSPVIEKVRNTLPDLLTLGQNIRCYFCGTFQGFGPKYLDHIDKCILKRRHLVCHCCGTTWLKLQKPFKCVKQKLLASGKKSFLFCYSCPHEFRQQPLTKYCARTNCAPKKNFSKSLCRYKYDTYHNVKRADKVRKTNRKNKLPTYRDKKIALKHLNLLREKLLCQRDRRDPSDANLAALCNSLEEGIYKLAVRTSYPNRRSNPTMSDMIHPSNTQTSEFETGVIGGNPVLPDTLKQNAVMVDNRSDAASFYKDKAISQLREIINQAPRFPPVPVIARAENFQGSITQRLEDVLTRRRQQINRHLEEEAIRVGTVKRCSVLLERLPPVANQKRVTVEEDYELVVPCKGGGLNVGPKVKWMDGYGYVCSEDLAQDCESYRQQWADSEKRRLESLLAQRKLTKHQTGDIMTASRSTWNSLSSSVPRSNLLCTGIPRKPMAEMRGKKRKLQYKYVEHRPKWTPVRWVLRSYPDKQSKEFAVRLRKTYSSKKISIDKDFAAGKTNFCTWHADDPGVPSPVAVTMELLLFCIDRVHSTIQDMALGLTACQSLKSTDGLLPTSSGKKLQRGVDGKFCFSQFLRKDRRLYFAFRYERSQMRQWGKRLLPESQLSCEEVAIELVNVLVNTVDRAHRSRIKR